MNPQNGEILAMVDVPEFDLNNPYTLPNGMDASAFSKEKRQELLNAMWRNGCINDTYEPGSTFKIITAAAGLESGSVKPTDTFSCRASSWWRTERFVVTRLAATVRRTLCRAP